MNDHPPRRRSLATTVVVLGIIFAYILLRPSIQRRFGIDLPDPLAERAPAERETTGDLPGSAAAPAPAAPENSTPPAAEQSPAEDERPAAGELTELRDNVWESTAGLVYGPGSREGHRLKHVLRHAEDLPQREGRHGVFHGDRETILALLDEAYQIAQQRGPPVRTERDGARTIHTVDMGRVIGYEGGRSGNRDGRPELRRVRLVLEGRKVITAYPVR